MCESVGLRHFAKRGLWYVVRSRCQRAGLERIAPHDLRRTCAKLCHDRGGELEDSILARTCIGPDHGARFVEHCSKQRQVLLRVRPNTQRRVE